MATSKDINFNPPTVGWDSEESVCLYDLRWPKSWVERVQKADWPHQGGVIWISTSGTSSTSDLLSFVGLKKSSLLVSAHSVNEHVNSDNQDIWLNTLPIYHVGGLSVYARSFLSGAKVEDISQRKWSANYFVENLVEKKVTLTSLVPTQLYDLLNLNVEPPPSLRVVFVGGAALAPKLYQEARKLDWPILPTYGMTEMGSQVATSPLKSLDVNLSGSSSLFQLQPLKHVEVKVDSDDLILIRSNSAMMGRLKFDGEVSTFEPFGSETFYKSQDLGILEKDSLRVLGRADDSIKVRGEWVNLGRLNLRIQDLAFELQIERELVILAIPHSRSGYQIVLVVEGDSILKESKESKGLTLLLQQMEKDSHPFERIEGVYFVEKFPRTSLGKIKTKLLEQILF